MRIVYHCLVICVLNIQIHKFDEWSLSQVRRVKEQSKKKNIDSENILLDRNELRRRSILRDSPFDLCSFPNYLG